MRGSIRALSLDNTCATHYPARARSPPRLTPRIALKIYRLIPLVLLALVWGCDTSPTSSDSGHLVADARRFVEGRQAALRSSSSLARRGGETVNEELLEQYYPDWQSGQVVGLEDGGTAVVVTLGPNAEASFDSTVSILRTLIVTRSADGLIQDGEIVEFATPDAGDQREMEDVSGLVQTWKRNDFGSERFVVAEYSLGYSPQGGTSYFPDRQPQPVEVVAANCDEGDGSSNVTRRVCYRIVDLWHICFDDGQCGSWQESQIDLSC